MSPIEPVLPKGDITVGKVVEVGRITVITLLTAIIAGKVPKGADILVVAHGVDEGLTIPLAPGSKSMLQIDAVSVLREVVAGTVTGRQGARRLLIKEAELTQLLQLRKAILKLKLQRVELRACTIGSKVATLKELRWFFGSDSLSAPVVFDAYGVLGNGTPTTNPDTWAAWLKAYPGAVVEGTHPNRFAWEGPPGLLIEHWLADSHQAVKDWIAGQHPGAKWRSGQILYHCFLETSSLVFPKDGAAYRGLLRRDS